MMKISGRVTSCCVALFFVLNSVSAVQKNLSSINDLKKIDFDNQSVPKHSLLLLYWFANTVEIDENDVIWLTFDPNSRAYGSHYYSNFEGLLVPLHRGSGYRYYSVGSLNQETSMQLPPYVVRPPRGYEGTNSDRIIIRAREQNIGGRASQRIDQVYITQHIERQGEYDPDHTYRITTDLLRQIREFSVGGNQQQLLQLRNRYGSNADGLQLSHIRNTWGDLAGLGLLLFIVIQEKYIFYKQNNRPQNNYTPENNYTPQHSPQNYRPQTIYTPQYTPQNYRTGNIQNNGDNEAIGIFFGLALLVFFCLIIRALLGI